MRALKMSVAAIAAVMLAAASGPASALSEAEAKKLVEDSYKVKVLRVAKDELAGKTVYRMKIMNPAANFNGAMQVSVVNVDAESGTLMPTYRHRVSGIDENVSPSLRPNRQAEEALSSRAVWR